MRVERNKAATIDQRFYVDGVLTNSTDPVTVAITREDGTVLTSGAATTNPETGVYRYVLAPQSDLDRLTLTYTGTWSGVAQSETQTVEIVGDFYLTLNALRALPNLDNVTKFTDAELIAARTWFETTFERATGVAWVPRYARDRVAGTNAATLTLPKWPVRRVYSVHTYTTASAFSAFTAAELADIVVDGGALRRFGGTYFTHGYANLVVAYEHGFDRPPADVVEAAKVAIRDRLLSDHTGNRAYAVQTEQGIVRSSTPGRDHPFGIPSVDEVVTANDYRIPAVSG